MSEMWILGLDLECNRRISVDRLGWLAQAALAMSKRVLRVFRSHLPHYLVAALWLAASATAADPQPFVPAGCVHPITVERLHDADTVFGAMDLGIEGLTITPKGGWRAGGFDACEVNRDRERVVGPITDEEIAIGKRATADLAGLIKQGQLYGRPTAVTDPHGRGSADLFIKLPNGWLDVAAWMQAHGYLRSQLPATKPK
jgi:hypothetical protein